MPICSLSQLTASASTITPDARSTRNEEKNATSEVPMSRSANSFDRSRLVFPDSRRKPNRSGTQGPEKGHPDHALETRPQPPGRHPELRPTLERSIQILEVHHS